MENVKPKSEYQEIQCKTNTITFCPSFISIIELSALFVPNLNSLIYLNVYNISTAEKKRHLKGLPYIIVRKMNSSNTLLVSEDSQMETRSRLSPRYEF